MNYYLVPIGIIVILIGLWFVGLEHERDIKCEILGEHMGYPAYSNGLFTDSCTVKRWAD